MLESERLRAQARQCRTIARSVDTEGTKKTLIDIADECEVKAAQLERYIRKDEDR